MSNHEIESPVQAAKQQAGRIMRALREEQGLSIEDIVRRLQQAGQDIDPKTIIALETGNWIDSEDS